MAAHPARPRLQVRAGERRGHDPQRPADQHPFRPPAAARRLIFLPSGAGEVARRSGGVMSSTTAAHDPSARFAGPSPSKTMGRPRYLTAMHIPPHAKRGEVARRAGGVMGSTTDAHDPSARFADTSPSKTMGRRSYRARRRLRRGAGMDVHL